MVWALKRNRRFDNGSRMSEGLGRGRDWGGVESSFRGEGGFVHTSSPNNKKGPKWGLSYYVAERVGLLLAMLVAPSGPSPLGGDVVSADFIGLGSNQSRLRFMKGP